MWWIRQALHSAVQRQSRTVQVPLNRAADLSRVRAPRSCFASACRASRTKRRSPAWPIFRSTSRAAWSRCSSRRGRLDEPAISGEPGRTLGETLVLDRGEDEDVLPGGIESDSRREAIGRALEVLRRGTVGC